MKAKSRKPRDVVKPRRPAAEPLTFEQWKRAVGVPVLGTRLMRPRDWRDLYISGATPEQAKAYLETARYNTVAAPTLRPKRR
jgi:hypothetical protein